MDKQWLIQQIEMRLAAYPDRSALQPNTAEEQAKWFVAYQLALEIRDYSTKDIARMVYDSSYPKVDDAGINEWLAEQAENMWTIRQLR